MTREQMIDEVIRTRGFEDRWTVWFCTTGHSLLSSEKIL